jgi:hypothetical protein
MNLWRAVRGHTISKAKQPRVFLLYGLYAQGMPLLICLITAIVDASRPLKLDQIGGRKITKHYSNMGQLRCFVGEQQDQKGSYFESAQFIYCDMFMLLVQTANLFFLGSILAVLRRDWESQARVLELQGRWES